MDTFNREVAFFFFSNKRFEAYLREIHKINTTFLVRFSIIRRSKLLVSNKGRQNAHKIMPDEPSESAERWLSQLRPLALAVDSEGEIPFIDSDQEDGSSEVRRRHSLAEDDLETIEEIPPSDQKFPKSFTFSGDLSLNLIQKSR